MAEPKLTWETVNRSVGPNSHLIKLGKVVVGCVRMSMMGQGYQGFLSLPMPKCLEFQCETVEDAKLKVEAAVLVWIRLAGLMGADDGE